MTLWAVDNAEVARLYVEEKMPVRAVAERLGVDRQVVQYRLKIAGVPRRPRSIGTRSLPPMGADQRRLYLKLRRAGIDRAAAIATATRTAARAA